MGEIFRFARIIIRIWSNDHDSPRRGFLAEYEKLGSQGKV